MVDSTDNKTKTVSRRAPMSHFNAFEPEKFRPRHWRRDRERL